jgi:hypothetical protein
MCCVGYEAAVLRTFLLIPVVAALLCGCSQPAAQNASFQQKSGTEACAHRPRNWTYAGPGYSISGLEFNEIEVRRDGALLWNGVIKSEAEVRQYFDLVATIQPPVTTVLRAPVGSDCAIAERLRAFMDAHPHCQREGCVESSRWAAMNLPTFAEDQAWMREREGR